MTLAQKSDRILAQTRGLSGATPNATQLIEELRWALEAYRQENARLTAERDEARRIACDADAAYRMSGWSDQQYYPSLAREIATERGWNCFAEEEKQ